MDNKPKHHKRVEYTEGNVLYVSWPSRLQAGYDKCEAWLESPATVALPSVPVVDSITALGQAIFERECERVIFDPSKGKRTIPITCTGEAKYGYSNWPWPWYKQEPPKQYQGWEEGPQDSA